MIHYCTYFDKRYIHRGLALYRSLVRNCQVAPTLWVLCLDDETFGALQKLAWPGLAPIRLVELEQDYPPLLTAKNNRSVVEYYWTLTPAWVLYLLKKAQAETLAYLDADMLALGKTDVLDDVLGTGSVLIVPHDYGADYRDMKIDSGKYNVGLLIFKNDPRAITCLQWWRDRCIEWCYDRKEGDKYGDQGYLNDWPKRFPGVVISSHCGLGLAPWNICSYQLTQSEGRLYCAGGQLAVFYHFHKVRFCTRRLVWLTGWYVYLGCDALILLYRPYVSELVEIEAMLLANNMLMAIPRVAIPWRYLAGRIVRRQPLRNFMLAACLDSK